MAQSSATAITLRVNGSTVTVQASPDTPLLYILQNDLALKGPRFGCGLAQCGSCSVLVDDRELRACITPVRDVAGRSITTLEGIAAWSVRRRKVTAPEFHPVQTALAEEQAPQCGYCMNGMVIKAAELLDQTPNPSEAQIRSALNGHLCRCGAYPSIIRAIQKAATSE